MSLTWFEVSTHLELITSNFLNVSISLPAYDLLTDVGWASFMMTTNHRTAFFPPFNFPSLIHSVKEFLQVINKSRKSSYV